VIRLRLPALRERREDVPMLTRHFLQQSAQQLGVDPKRIADAALARLELFAFPGNVRQLENVCHWLTVMAPAQVIEPKDLPPEVLSGTEGVAVTAHEAPTLATPAAAIAMPPLPASPAPIAVQSAELPLALPTLYNAIDQAWELGLEHEALLLLESGRTDVWDVLCRRFESKLIITALHNTKGRRIEAAQKLGIGRNTITRKIQELGLE